MGDYIARSAFLIRHAFIRQFTNIEKMKSLAIRYKVDVSVYALMPNHYHLMPAQSPKGSLSSMMGALAASSAKRYNLRYVAWYILLNPVRAGLAREPDEWKFSNFRLFISVSYRG